MPFLAQSRIAFFICFGILYVIKSNLAGLIANSPSLFAL